MGWQTSFKSLADYTCHIYIDQGGTAITAADEPVKWEEDNTTDLLQVVRTKTGYLNLVETTTGELASIYPSLNGQRKVEIYRGSTLLFFGYMQAQNFDNDFAPAPYVVSLPITSPLGVFGEYNINSIPDITTTPTVTLGTIMKQICSQFSYNYVIIPKYLLDGGTNPMHVAVNSRVVSPFNDNYGFGEEDVFSPITYLDFIEGFCNLYGLIAHDEVYINNYNYRALVFTKFDYSGDYLLMSVSTLNDTSVTGTTLYSQSIDFDTFFDIADDNGRLSATMPIGRLDIDHGDYLEEIAMNLKLATLGNYPSGREGSLINIGKVLYFIPLSRAEGGELASSLLNTTDTAFYDNYSYQGNMVRVAGDGSREVIDLSFQHGIDPISDSPLLVYTFGLSPRTDFSLVMRTVNHENYYRFQIQSGSNFIHQSGSTYYWDSSQTILDRVGPNDDGYYVIDRLPATALPITVRVYQAEYNMTYWGDPITELKLSVKESPLAAYYQTRVNPVRTIKQGGSRRSDSIKLLFNDYINNPGRIIGGSLVSQNSYAYMFTSLRVLCIKAKRKAINTYDEATMMMANFSIGGATWRMVACGLDVWNDNLILIFMR